MAETHGNTKKKTSTATSADEAMTTKTKHVQQRSTNCRAPYKPNAPAWSGLHQVAANQTEQLLFDLVNIELLQTRPRSFCLVWLVPNCCRPDRAALFGYGLYQTQQLLFGLIDTSCLVWIVSGCYTPGDMAAHAHAFRSMHGTPSSMNRMCMYPQSITHTTSHGTTLHTRPSLQRPWCHRACRPTIPTQMCHHGSTMHTIASTTVRNRTLQHPTVTHNVNHNNQLS